MVIQQLEDDAARVSWAPSHMDFILCEDSVEEWRATWNEVVDFNAGLIKQQRDPNFMPLLQRDLAFFNLRILVGCNSECSVVSLPIADGQAQLGSRIPVFDAVVAIDDADWGWVAQHTTLNRLTCFVCRTALDLFFSYWKIVDRISIRLVLLRSRFGFVIRRVFVF